MQKRTVDLITRASRAATLLAFGAISFGAKAVVLQGYFSGEFLDGSFVSAVKEYRDLGNGYQWVDVINQTKSLAGLHFAGWFSYDTDLVTDDSGAGRTLNYLHGTRYQGLQIEGINPFSVPIYGQIPVANNPLGFSYPSNGGFVQHLSSSHLGVNVTTYGASQPANLVQGYWSGSRAGFYLENSSSNGQAFVPFGVNVSNNLILGLASQQAYSSAQSALGTAVYRSGYNQYSPTVGYQYSAYSELYSNRLRFDVITLGQKSTAFWTTLELAKVSGMAYGQEHTIVGAQVLPRLDTPDGFGAIAVRLGDEIVVAFKGTDPKVKDMLLADASWASSSPTSQLKTYTNTALGYLALIRNSCSNCRITLTGHSLGGAVASIVGKAVLGVSDVVTFNSPGIDQWRLSSFGLSVPVPGGTGILSTNYRLQGDFFSQAGIHTGSTITMVGQNAGDGTVASMVRNCSGQLCLLNNHEISQIIGAIQTGGQPAAYGPDVRNSLQNFGYSQIAASPDSITLRLVGYVASSVDFLFDPPPSSSIEFVVEPGSPKVAGILFPQFDIGGLTAFASFLEGASWSQVAQATTGQWLGFLKPINGVRFELRDADGNTVPTPEYLMGMRFASTGALVGQINVFAPVPELPTPWLLLLGGAGALWWRRRARA